MVMLITKLHFSRMHDAGKLYDINKGEKISNRDVALEKTG